MASSQKFRLTLVIQPPMLLHHVLFCFYWPALCRMCVLVYYGLRVCGQKYIILYVTVCKKVVVPRLNKHNDVIEWNFMKIAPPKWRAGCAPALEWPSQEDPGSCLTAPAPVSDVSTPTCTNGVCPPLRPVSVVQKNKPSTMLSSNAQSIDLPMDCMAWRCLTMRQLNGCSTPAPRSSVAKQWFQQLAQKKKGFYY